MLRKIILSSFILLFIGMAGLSWVWWQDYLVQKQMAEQQTVEKYLDRFEERIDRNDRMNPLMKVFLTTGLRLQIVDQAESNFKSSEATDLTFAISALFAVVGAVILLILLIDLVAKAIIRTFKWFFKALSLAFKITKKQKQKEKAEERLKREEEQRSKFDVMIEPETEEKAESFVNQELVAVGKKTMTTIYEPEDREGGSSTATAKKTSIEQTQQLEEVIKSQFTELQKQILEVRELAETSPVKTSQRRSDDSLNQLTKQVAAINEFASKQQDRVRKLQDGYDWNIVKNFCLKIIRSLDNLEKTIQKFQDENQDTTILEQTRDDFIFALESSNVEQFAPKTGTEYRGNERFAEALAERVATSNGNLKGKIAEIVRNGYQYVIDEQNYKVVRVAQVKLYG